MQPAVFTMDHCVVAFSLVAAAVSDPLAVQAEANSAFWIAAAASIAFAILGLVIGYTMGRSKARSSSEDASVQGRVFIGTDQLINGDMTADQRERMLQLLHEIGSYTNEYSDKVSAYQDELGELSKRIQSGQSVGPSVSQTSERIIELLQQFMHNNADLQTKLDMAESQLEQKTRQIECYLNEARTDSLTGLLNRRAFDQKLEELFHNHRRGGSSFVVALIDVDHFKSVNDSYGHQTGDRTLKAIAGLLSERLQGTLMVARFGGEEFAVIMDGPINVAAEKLDALRQSLSTHVIDIDSTKLHSSISIGMSEPTDDTGAAPLLRRADEALYAAKNYGRNRVYYHDGKAPTLFGTPETATNG